MTNKLKYLKREYFNKCQATHIFEDEESEIWLKKAFQANKKMWELMCEAIKNEDLELDKNKDYDE